MASSYAYQEDFTQMSRHSLFQLPVDKSKKYGQRSKLCWNNSSPTKEGVQPKGFVTFSLTNGPEYHVSQVRSPLFLFELFRFSIASITWFTQVANAVLVAKYLGGTLVLPEIIGNKGEKRRFDEIYDADKFITSMSGVIQVEARKHHEASTKKFIDVKVPYNANRNYIMHNVGPIFQTTQNVRVISYFPSSTTKLAEVDKDTNPYSCWTMFEALHLKPELQKVVDSIVGSLQSRDPNGQFVAIDYKTEMLGTSTCQSNANEGMKNCYNPVEIAQFLQRIGYQRDSTIYVTQSKADRSLSLLKDLYPKTFTKEDIMQEAKMGETSELEQEIIDFHICSVSEVFVPAKSGLFYANVVGNRIATSRIDVLVPAQITSNLAQDHVSSFIAKASHPAYACFCQ
ncbi:putative GDP-fucose protein O-fucosyltransferase [Helianthus annuus]|nr:putative GDP-fucose protein O-fucosyltransferase [Helianthus annuus]